MNVSDTITITAGLKIHPAPWRVEYWQRFDTWHPKAFPHVMDAAGKLVCDLPQHVTAEAYDAIADTVAHTIADSVNHQAVKERCPECGYTRDDCQTHGDHHLCEKHPHFEDEIVAAELLHLTKKAEHGCASAYCRECDGYIPGAEDNCP